MDWFVQNVVQLISRLNYSQIFLLNHKNKHEDRKNNLIAVCSNCNHSWTIKTENDFAKSLRVIVPILMVFIICVCSSLWILIDKERSGYFIDATLEPTNDNTNVAQTVIVSLTQTSEYDVNSIHTQVAGTMQANELSKPTKTASPEVVISETTEEADTELAAYLSRKYQQLFECSDILDALSFEFTYISENPDAFFNTTIMDNLYSELDQFDDSCTNFYEENVPEKAKSVNEYFKLIDQEFSICYDDLVYGLTYLDFDSLDEATDHMTKATDYFLLATEEIENMSE